MKGAVKIVIYRLLKFVGLFSLFRWVNRQKTIILVYHGITAESSFLGLFNHAGLHVNIDKFVEQMQHVRGKYNVISLTEFLSANRNRSRLPRYSVVLTFDDGYENNYTQAFPILSRWRLPATIFLATHYIGRNDLFWSDRLELLFSSDECLSRILPRVTQLRPENNSPKALLQSLIVLCKSIADDQKVRLIEELENACASVELPRPPDYRCLTWDQIREMCASGLIDIGSHTHNHVIMTRVTPDQACEQAATSKRVLHEAGGISTSLFSYPNGQYSDIDHDTHATLASQGFSCGLLSVEGLNGAQSSPFALKRIGIDANTSIVEFEARITGFHLFASKLVQRIWKRP
jgi:peptidoglycan/xylan/chitin deacetylase (PgdA/CDA1 family)